MTRLLHGAEFPGPLRCDGRSVVIRAIRPHDAEPMKRFVEHGLSPASRRARFHAPVRSLPPAQIAALTQVDQFDHVALVAEPFEADGAAGGATVIVAEARFVVEAPGHGAEIALAVADAWQGVGLGLALLGHLCRLGRLRGLLHLRADVLVDNVAMLSLLRRRGALGGRHPDDATLCRLRVPTRRPDSPVMASRGYRGGRSSLPPLRSSVNPCIAGDS